MGITRSKGTTTHRSNQALDWSLLIGASLAANTNVAKGRKSNCFPYLCSAWIGSPPVTILNTSVVLIARASRSPLMLANFPNSCAAAKRFSLNTCSGTDTTFVSPTTLRSTPSRTDFPLHPGPRNSTARRNGLPA